jgi:hypothetical protein
MLEQEIKTLTEEVRALRLLLTTIAKDVAYYRPEGEQATAPTPVTSPPPATTSPAPPPIPAVTATTPDRAAIQSRCLDLVRADRNHKAAIAAAMLAYNGAKTINSIPEDCLASFAADLAAIDIAGAKQ